MSTTPSRKVPDSKKKSSHIRYDENPPYFGDVERFTSGSANADRYEPITRQSSVEGMAREADMCDMPGKEFEHIPEEGNKPARKRKGGNPTMPYPSGAQIGRAGGRSY